MGRNILSRSNALWAKIQRIVSARSAASMRQCAALPFVILPNGAIEIALITSRDTGRWIIPKGWPEGHLSPYALAAKEAHEEAGLHGRISATPLGAYSYRKQLHTFSSITCEVSVYPLLVVHQLRKWPEHHQRKRAWFTPHEAATRVAEPELAAILRAISALGPTTLAALTDDQQHATVVDTAGRSEA